MDITMKKMYIIKGLVTIDHDVHNLFTTEMHKLLVNVSTVGNLAMGLEIVRMAKEEEILIDSVMGVEIRVTG